MDLHGEPTSHLIMSRSWQDFAKIMGVVSFELSYIRMRHVCVLYGFEMLYTNQLPYVTRIDDLFESDEIGCVS